MVFRSLHDEAEGASMKLQTMLLVIAAAWLAAVPSRSFAQDRSMLAQLAAWQEGSLRADLGVDNPALLYPAEDWSAMTAAVAAAAIA